MGSIINALGGLLVAIILALVFLSFVDVGQLSRVEIILAILAIGLLGGFLSSGLMKLSRLAVRFCERALKGDSGPKAR